MSTITKRNTKPAAKRLLAVRYDARSYSVWFDRNQVSISTTQGRQRFSIRVPEFAREYTTWRTGSADLVYQRGVFYTCVTVKRQMPEPEKTGDCIGVDLGLNKLAVTSNNIFFAGKCAREVRNRYFRLRKHLQAKGTPSTKRHLKRLSRKEKRFQHNANHVISKRIVDNCNTGDTVALEDLRYIRSRIRSQRKNKRHLHSWAFAELQTFIQYKAQASGVNVVYVAPEYTSQRCSRCGYISRSNRHGESFQCESCGYQFTWHLPIHTIQPNNTTEPQRGTTS